MNDIVSKIADRAVAMFGCNKIDIYMDLDMCIEGGCELDLERLLNANDYDFAHDISGIHTYLNHETKVLTRGFLPRFAI